MGGPTQSGDAILLDEFDLGALPEELRTFLDALAILVPQGHDRESRLVLLLREIFTAGLKTGMKHADEIRARQLTL
ncbi:MAG: hypothetical protein Q8P07_04880 [bacterium]|nr:hypothetical protein [bacterium]